MEEALHLARAFVCVCVRTHVCACVLGIELSLPPVRQVLSQGATFLTLFL